MRTPLPIDDVLPDLLGALGAQSRAVLQAPPGAGKTTRVPLALHRAGLAKGKIIMLEPRRLAARSAAERLASELGEAVGGTVGYVMRGARTPGSHIDVVTEGVLTRMIQSDPELTGIGAVIFDEFHERSLNADLGLALCLEIRQALREDLMLIVMSATLDAAPVAALMDDAPVITSHGRSYPVEPVFLPRPLGPKPNIPSVMASVIETAMAQTQGGILAFLPGEFEIRRTAALLAPALPASAVLRPLYGAMPFKEQRAAIRPEQNGQRKIVLATSIAETSLTIEDIRVVVDAGLARRARFDPGSGMSRLVTERVSRAEADQRAGRAGRVAPGHAYKLWAKGENGALPLHPPTEMESADLSALALELAQWGAQPDDLPFLTPPPEAALIEARSLLTMLGALDARAQITAHGKALARLPLHPRLAHMLLRAGPQASELAAILSTRDPVGPGRGCDLDLRLKALRAGHAPDARAEAKRFKRFAGPAQVPMSLGAMAALAYPDRIGQRRKGDAARFVLSGGKGAVMEDSDGLAAERYVVVTNTDGNPREAKVRQAAALPLHALRDLFEDHIAWHETCAWSKRARKVVAHKQERLGTLVLDERLWHDAPDEQLARAMLDGVRDLGLTLGAPAERFRTRIELLRAAGEDLPDFSTPALMADLETWLLPYLTGITTAGAFRNLALLEPLRARLTWDEQQRLDSKAPAHHITPLGRKVAVDYTHGTPQIELRLQEMFGTTRHPIVAGQPLRVVLLSPAGRPVQTTTDIPAFWDTSYADVRKDMRGRYPRHPWPENPRDADPTLRVKRPRS